MKPSRSTLVAVVIGFVGAGSAVHAQSRLDPATLGRYEGDYSPACQNPAAPHLRVLPDGLVFDGGKGVLTGRNPRENRAGTGPNPLPGYQTALVSDISGNGQVSPFVFKIFRDPEGLYINLDGDAKVRTVLKAMLSWKFKRCSATATPSASATTAPPPPPSATALVVQPPKAPVKSAFLMMNKPFLALFHKALGPKVDDDWLVDGPETDGNTVTVEGTDYLIATSCQPHDCGDNTLIVLYAAAQKVVFGKLVRSDVSRLLGMPSPAVTAALDRLWAVAFRQGGIVAGPIGAGRPQGR
jgi:hypothetical protein